MALERITGYARSRRGDDGSHWLTVSDLMAGLMMIFLFIAIIFMQHLEDSIGSDAVPRWEHERVVEELNNIKEKFYQLRAEHGQLVIDHTDLKKKYTSLVVNHEDLTQQYLDLKETYLQLQKEYHEVREELDLVREQLKVLLESFGDIDKKYADLKIEHSQAIIDLRTKKRKVEELLVLIDHLERKLIALSNLSVEELRKLIEDIDWIKNHLSQILKEFHLAAQHQLLQEISGEISREGLDVEIDHKNSVLRLTEDTVQFSFASDDERYRAHYDNTRKALGTLEKIADVLATVLPCYAGAAASGCSSLYVGTLKSVLIEGHSDKGSIGGGWFGGHQNQYHSVLRAMTVYQDMVQKNNLLSDLVNSDGNKLFAVAGYGTDRPLPGHEDTESDTANRRIELRFIMTPPKLDPEIMLRIEKLGVK